MGLYDDLLQWSRSQPLWQRDALRQLVAIIDLGEEAIERLAAMALAPDDMSQAPDPVGTGHIPVGADADSDVCLSAIKVVENLNALLPSARLAFELHGMTVVYGGNGSGKSGYVRVLKRVCRARGTPEPVLPNVVRTSAARPQALIEYRVNDETRAQPWTDGTVAAPELSKIAVFDRACAAVYVNSENEVAYRPLGLDLIDRLAATVQRVRRRLEAMRFQGARTSGGPPVEVAAAEALRGIWPPGPNIEDRLAQAQWTDIDEADLDRLTQLLNENDPARAIAALESTKAELVRARRECESATQAMAAAEAIPVLLANIAVAERTLQRQQSGERFAFDNVGGAIWRALWSAARDFSNQKAYPTHEFPNTEAGARCVLCGQELSQEAQERFLALEELFEQALSEQVRAQDEELARLTRQIDSFREAGDVASRLPALRAIEGDLYLEVEASLTEAIGWLAHPEQYAQPSATRSEALAAAQQAVIGQIRGVDAGIADLRRTTSAAELLAMKHQRTELSARQWVAANIETVRVEAGRLALQLRVRDALATCDTQPITIEGNTLTERYVTQALRDAFAAELAFLNPSRVPVRISQRGSYGATYHRLQVATTSTVAARVADIVSDGEFRGLAIANYLAETGNSTSCSALVLDDPVTSLDHQFRARVAARLADQAIQRQVVVFTHDLVFMQDLESACERVNARIAFRTLGVRRAHVGVPQEGLPWDGMKVGQRIDVLQLDLNRLRDLHADSQDDAYENGVDRWYSRLRSTWERGVEELLFGDVVGRFRAQIKTNSLSTLKVWLIDEQDVRDVEGAMTKCSALTDAHDEPAAVARPIPLPNELRTDLDQLRNWRARIMTRRAS